MMQYLSKGQSTPYDLPRKRDKEHKWKPKESESTLLVVASRTNPATRGAERFL
jgi:hypothetical protein